MSWAVGFDEKWQRDIGYGVPAFCDFPKCWTIIDRGLSHVCCGENPYGGEYGCGLYFCDKHHPYFKWGHAGVCTRCYHYRFPFRPTPDHPDWVRHKATDPSWEKWRRENGAVASTTEAESEVGRRVSTGKAGDEQC